MCVEQLFGRIAENLSFSSAASVCLFFVVSGISSLLRHLLKLNVQQMHTHHSQRSPSSTVDKTAIQRIIANGITFIFAVFVALMHN